MQIQDLSCAAYFSYKFITHALSRSLALFKIESISPKHVDGARGTLSHKGRDTQQMRAASRCREECQEPLLQVLREIGRGQVLSHLSLLSVGDVAAPDCIFHEQRICHARWAVGATLHMGVTRCVVVKRAGATEAAEVSSAMAS